MRVLVAHDVSGTREGGMTRIMRFIHSRLTLRGYETDYLHAEQVQAHPLLRRFAFPRAVFEHVLAQARAGRPYAIVNVHEPSALNTLLRRRQLGDVRIAVTSHGVEQRAWELALEEARLGREGPSLKTRVVYPATSLWQSRYNLRHADHVFCLNEEDRAYLHDRLGVPPDRTSRMVPGADPCFARAAEHRTYADARHLLFAATWRKNKGIEDLVPAVNELLSAHPDCDLTVLGAGVDPSVVTNAFAEEVRARIRCVNAATEDATARAFAAADIFLLPSLFEGTPLTLMEAMMSGLPIVTTSVCGMKDVVENGRHGLLVPIRSPRAIVDAVRRLMSDRTERASLGIAARHEAVEQYTWDHAADRVADAYDHLSGRTAVPMAS